MKMSPAVVAIVPRPARQHDLAADVAFAQLAARGGMHAVFVHEVRHRVGSLLLSTAICICRPTGARQMLLKLSHCTASRECGSK